MPPARITGSRRRPRVRWRVCVCSAGLFLPSAPLLRLVLLPEFQKNICSSCKYELNGYPFHETFPDKPLAPISCNSLSSLPQILPARRGGKARTVPASNQPPVAAGDSLLVRRRFRGSHIFWVQSGGRLCAALSLVCADAAGNCPHLEPETAACGAWEQASPELNTSV